MAKEKRIHKSTIMHIASAVVAVAILSVCIVALLKWNNRAKSVEINVEEGSFDKENLDYYIYPDHDENYIDDGVRTVLVIGDHILNNFGKKHSILNILKENIDAEFIDLTTNKGKIASDDDIASYAGAFSLYYILEALINADATNMELYGGDSVFSGDTATKYENFLKTLDSVDLNKVDTILIMYSNSDYYSLIPLQWYEKESPRGIYGALTSSFELIKENYPNIEIIFSSPTPAYIYGDDGEIQIDMNTNYGQGLGTDYMEYFNLACNAGFVSFIDNYYYVIDESNITEYLDCMNLTDKGIDAIAEHIIKFIKAQENPLPLGIWCS